AEDRVLKRKVALKFLRAETADDPKAATRFLREARAAAAIDSEHVVRVFDAGKHPLTGELYLVLELLRGDDLSRVLRRRGPLPVAEAVEYAQQAARAISLAHARGIIHRDLKPANLFLADREGVAPIIKVLDFGIAKFAAALDDSLRIQTSANTI